MTIAISALVGALLLASGLRQDYSSLFRYDRSVSLDVTVERVIARDSARIRYLSFNSIGGGRVTGILVEPSAKGPRPCVVYQHQLGSTKEEFIAEALIWTRLRSPVCAVTVDAPFARAGDSRRVFDATVPNRDRELQVQAIVDLRRSIDVLESLDVLDGSRIAIVGHSYGANWAGILAAVEPRLRASVMMAGVARVTDAVRREPQALNLAGELLTRYLDSISPLDPMDYIARAPRGLLLLQFGDFDPEIPAPDTEAFMRFAQSHGHTVRQYSAGHELNAPSALMERLRFISTRLGIKPLPDLKDIFGSQR